MFSQQSRMERSDENGGTDLLGLFRGAVRRFDGTALGDNGLPLKIPHMGWNSLYWTRDVPVMKGLEQGCYIYFVHSYHVVPRDETVVATVTDHGGPFVSSIWRDNVVATQFHPEKSHTNGLQLLQNFMAWDGRW